MIDELINSVKLVQNIAALLVIHSLPVLYPANSCTELAQQKTTLDSQLCSHQSKLVFCEMGDVFQSSLNVARGWVMVGNLNMTDPDQHY